MISERLPEREEATGTPPENTDAGVDILGDLFFHKDSGTGKHHHGVLETFC